MRGQANDLATNWMLSRNLDFTRDYLTAIHDVTADQVQAAAQRYLLPDKLSSVSLNPKGTLTTTDKVATESSEQETRKFTLDNGLTVLLQEDHRVPLISVRACFFAGLLGETAETSGLTQLASRCLLKGTNKRDAATLAEIMEGVGGSIGASAGNNTVSVAASCLDQDLDLALDVVSDVLLHPTFPEEEVDREKTAQIAGIKAESDHLVTLAVRRLRQTLFAGHPYERVRVGDESTVQALTSTQTQSFHKEHITAQNGILAVYGAIDSVATEALIKRHFETLPSGQRVFDEITQPSALTESEVIDLATDKQQAVLVTGYPGVSIDSPDRLAMDTHRGSL